MGVKFPGKKLYVTLECPLRMTYSPFRQRETEGVIGVGGSGLSIRRVVERAESRDARQRAA